MTVQQTPAPSRRHPDTGPPATNNDTPMEKSLMTKSSLRVLLGALAAASALAGCGGGGGSSPAASTDVSGTGATTYAALLSQLNTPAGLAGSRADAVFHDDYLDSGMTKPQVIEALSKEGAALSASSEHSLFPQAALSDVQLTGCDANNVCTLTGTLLNSDADNTSIQFSTRVVNSNGTYRLLGDQSRV